MRGRILLSFRSLALAACALGAPIEAAHGQAQSASFRLVQSTLDGGGEESASSTRRAWGSIGQELTIGTSAAPHAILQSGFWSFLGSSLVPVLLTLDKDGGIPASPELTWSGNNPPYTIYRATDCAGVFGGVLAVEPTNTHTDGSSFPDGLTCYNVLATAPGPFTLPAPREGAPSP